MKRKIDLSIIILNYNAGQFVVECLESVENADKGGLTLEIIVVDNASTDDSLEKLKELNKIRTFQLIENKENFGFARGNNVGLPKANGRYILFLNPDTLVNKDTLIFMVNFMDQNDKVGAATCKLELPGGRLDDAAHRGFPTPWNAFSHFFGLENIFPNSRLFSGYGLGYLSRNTIHEIDALSGAFMIVRRRAGEEVGWWDEDYFWYGEDIDFSYRLKEKGWKIMYVPEVSIIHYKGVSSGVKKHTKEISTASRETRKRSARASIAAMKIFYKKHYFRKYPAPVLWLVWGGIWLLEKYRLLFW